MDPTYPAEALAYRDKIRTLLSEHLPPGWAGIGALEAEEATAFSETWRSTLHAAGLLAPSWPKEYGGGGLSKLEQVILAEELNLAGAPSGIFNDLFSIQMIGNTLLQWGTAQQKDWFIPRILSGEDRWCQGYSEPNAGSDLGSVAMRADLDGDEWVINGQKTWTSGAHRANWIFLLARTDPDVPKHKGITFLLCPMDQPGIDVRPVRMLSGESEFNEVYFTNARCPKANVVGEVNGGWSVAMTLLGFERGEANTTVGLRFRTEFDRLVELARARGRADDPVVRQQLAWCFARVEVMRYLGMRTLTAFLSGATPGADAAVFKLFWSEYHKRVTEIALELLGADAMAPEGKRPNSSSQTDEPGAPNDGGSWVGTFLNARAGTIYAGSSEVQRNIVGELLLGLPREPRGSDLTWREEQRSR